MHEVARFTATWIGLRYLRGQRRQFASLITWVSIVGLALGVAMLVVVLSVMNGFDAELKRRILGLVPQLVAVPPKGTLPSEPPSSLRESAGAGAAFRFFAGEGMVARNGGVHAIAVYGLGAEGANAVDVLEESMLSGRVDSLDDGAGGLLMGAPLARHLGLGIGDAVTIVLTEPRGDSIRPRLERFTLSGLFEVGADLDYGVVFVGFDEIVARGLAPAGEAGIRFVIDEPLAVESHRAALAKALPADWRLHDWRESYGELFRAVRLEKGMMFMLLLLIVAIAAFNIVSAQTMLVNEKRTDIAILRTMGASDALVARMVLMQGLVVALAGIGVGVALGLVLALNVTASVGLLETLIGARLLEGTYFEEIPVEVLPLDLVAVVGVSLVLCVVSALHPARRAAALNPAEALH
jgi:lipoprotein-releasing system permease protein